MGVGAGNATVVGSVFGIEEGPSACDATGLWLFIVDEAATDAKEEGLWGLNVAVPGIIMADGRGARGLS